MLNLDCVPISTYCKETGETPEAINKRVQRGVWREGGVISTLLEKLPMSRAQVLSVLSKEQRQKPVLVKLN
ncbi:hypothetical protein [Escherichia coli]|uniref:hypothetical protein n=1 Tax=Escherichia coli TaxID=562 RepID=UPI0039E1B10A